MVFDSLAEMGHEQVSYFSDPETDLQAIVAVHDTTLGPGLGGTRMLDYESESAALEDVLRLSRAMTYKAAAADLPLGGGKAVVVGDPERVKTEHLLEAYGRAVDAMGGRYVTSVDVNTGVADMDVVSRATDHVVGTSDGLGDPSPITAHGVFHGIRAAIEYAYGTDSVAGREVVVQGLGKVGSMLAERLLERDASVAVSDVDHEAVEAFAADHDVETVPPEAVYDHPCDVFAPCAVGGVVDDDTVDRLACDVVAGAANNVLAERRHAAALRNREILYAPDYVVNAGGLITVAKEYLGGSREDARDDAAAIGGRLLELFETADRRDVTPLAAAESYAEERIDAADAPTLASP